MGWLVGLGFEGGMHLTDYTGKKENELIKTNMVAYGLTASRHHLTQRHMSTFQSHASPQWREDSTIPALPNP